MLISDWSSDLCSSDLTDVALPHCTKGHDDPLRPFRHTALIMMWHHAGIHEGRSGIAIFMTEIRTDELALVIADSVTVQLQLRFDLFIARDRKSTRLHSSH